MGMIRLKIREFADEKGWTLKEVSDRSGVVYSTLRTYARSPGLATVDFTAIQKLARTFDVMIEELVEVVAGIIYTCVGEGERIYIDGNGGISKSLNEQTL